MATKSFITEMSFDKKSVNSLINALNNEKTPILTYFFFSIHFFSK